MNLPRPTFDLPLLTKDLIEQAALKRTYVLRVVYAVVLYGAALWVYSDISGRGVQSSVSNLGRGRELFNILVMCQAIAILVLLPAISCGAVTVEKERDTLGLLLITKLRPGTIVLEKLLSRLLAMGTYQLLSLPLFAVVYGIGGVELGELIRAIWQLAWLSVAVGMWSIFCSTWHRTTAGAFLSAYGLMPVSVMLTLCCCGGPASPFANAFLRNSAYSTANGQPFSTGLFISLALASTMPLMIISGVLYLMATALLVPRAFLPPRNLLLELFQQLDGFFERLNEATTRGIVLARDRDFLPLFDPIGWRETRKKSLGTVRYLFRLLVLLEAPLAAAIAWTVTDWQTRSFDGPVTFFLSVLWPIAIVAVVVHTTSVLASERSRQTLDVLLVTPLSQAELVTTKLAGVRRLIAVLSVPFATLVVFQAIWNAYVVRGLGLMQSNRAEFDLFLHDLLGLGLGTLLYLRLLQWLTFHVAMRLKNQTQAVLISLAVVALLCLAPLGIAGLIESVFSSWGDFSPFQMIDMIRWFSPVRVLFHRQFLVPTLSYGTPAVAPVLNGWLPVPVPLLLHFGVVAGVCLVLKQFALSGFSACVGRTEAEADALESPASVPAS
ncbi:MAG: ABC transporter permease subunit [Planctomycetota bacterium]